MERILRTVERYIPKKIYTFFRPAYHFLWSLVGAIVYRFPSRHLTVIGITGTKGKSSSSEILYTILKEAGYKTALSGTIHFIIGDKEIPNTHKMSMPGRMFMQKFLRQAVDAGCTHAVIESTSEGSKFFRHLFIAYDALLFLNLSPEHIEAHGSYENYVQAKVNIAKQVARCLKKEGAIIGNVDDKETEKFFAVKTPWYRKGKKVSHISYGLHDAKNYTATEEGISYTYKNTHLLSPLKGVFNIYNSLGCIVTAEHFNVPMNAIVNALKKLNVIRGRVEFVPNIKECDVVVDYAHTADSLRQLYETFSDRPKVCVLGSTGGGRDVWKRKEMGKVADTHCEHIILTNEDPYDENPMNIIENVREGITQKPCEIIFDRREAIGKAIDIARGIKEKKPIVLITGKGTDPYIMGPKNSKTPWSDMAVAQEEITKRNLNA